MHISFDPNQRTTPSLPNHEVRRTSQGIANNPSSIEFQLRANESSGGFCDWIRSIVEWIRNLLCFSSSSREEVSPQSPFEQRVTIAKDIIENHFQREPIIAADGSNSVIIVVMKYNGLCDVSYGITSRQKNNREAIHAKMWQLLARAPHAENDNGHLQIDTLLFTRTHNFFHVDTWKKFTADNRGSSGTGTGPLTQNVITHCLNTIITSSENRDEVRTFLANLRS